ncbi:MAG: addiction module protein [Planctomycetia bacterium]|nr:addiction module protein [Planctomycetia bacterium]
MKSLSLDKLSVPERILLAQELWDSVADDATALQLSPKQEQELDRRIAAYEADLDEGASWDQIKARLQGKS